MGVLHHQAWARANHIQIAVPFGDISCDDDRPLILLGIREVISCFVSAVAQTLGLYYCIHGIVPVTEKDCTWSLHQRTRGARAWTVAVLKANWAQGQLAVRNSVAP